MGKIRAIIIGYTRNIRSHFSRKNEDFFTICDTNILRRKPEWFGYAHHRSVVLIHNDIVVTITLWITSVTSSNAY